MQQETFGTVFSASGTIISHNQGSSLHNKPLAWERNFHDVKISLPIRLRSTQAACNQETCCLFHSPVPHSSRSMKFQWQFYMFCSVIGKEYRRLFLKCIFNISSHTMSSPMLISGSKWFWGKRTELCPPPTKTKQNKTKQPC